ncbi:molybdopterin-dependent oxidoreductase [Mycetohabitans sp. B46]|uniref:molybdopterin-dependent oxidoreductase n=1 Tax=Mycetohabitans sp. B46 TaxID=2772536 RepID=UPI00307DB115
MNKFATLARGLALILFVVGGLAQATPIQLDVTGNIQHTNVPGTHVYRFTEQEWRSMPRAQFTTATNWTPSSQFSGVLLSDVLSKVGAKGTTLRVTAHDGYISYAVPLSDAHRYGVILADQINGKQLTLRDFGPLFLVYPRDKFPKELNRSEVAGRFVWQVKSIEVR